jgi:hypothetical protein
MSKQSVLRGAAVAVALAVSVAVPITAGADQTSNSESPLIRGNPGFAGFCATGARVGPESGEVAVHRNPDGTVTINIVIRNGTPNSTYQLAMTCIAFFGTLTTNSQGFAAGHFVVANAPPAFTVDASNGVDLFVSEEVMTATP